MKTFWVSVRVEFIKTFWVSVRVELIKTMSPQAKGVQQHREQWTVRGKATIPS